MVGVLDCLQFSRKCISLRLLNARIELRGNWTHILLSLFAFQTPRLLSGAHVSNNRQADSSFDTERKQRLCATMTFKESHSLAVAVIQLANPLRPEARRFPTRARKLQIIKSAKGGETCALNFPPTKIIGRTSSKAKRHGWTGRISPWGQLKIILQCGSEQAGLLGDFNTKEEIQRSRTGVNFRRAILTESIKAYRLTLGEEGRKKLKNKKTNLLHLS